MNWQEIRTEYPHVWLVVEAIQARTEGSERVIPQMDVVGVFDADWEFAWQHYKTLHHAHKDREYYVLHTERVELNIGVLDSFGRIPEQV